MARRRHTDDPIGGGFGRVLDRHGETGLGGVHGRLDGAEVGVRDVVVGTRNPAQPRGHGNVVVALEDAPAKADIRLGFGALGVELDIFDDDLAVLDRLVVAVVFGEGVADRGTEYVEQHLARAVGGLPSESLARLGVGLVVTRAPEILIGIVELVAQGLDHDVPPAAGDFDVDHGFVVPAAQIVNFLCQRLWSHSPGVAEGLLAGLCVPPHDGREVTLFDAFGRIYTYEVVGQGLRTLPQIERALALLHEEHVGGRTHDIALGDGVAGGDEGFVGGGGIFLAPLIDRSATLGFEGGAVARDLALRTLEFAHQPGFVFVGGGVGGKGVREAGGRIFLPGKEDGEELVVTGLGGLPIVVVGLARAF